MEEEKEVLSDSWIKKNKGKIATFVFYFAIVFLIYGLIHIIVLLKSEGAECVKNPFTYAAGSISVQRGGQDMSELVSCSCSAGDENFCFNSKEVGECFTSDQYGSGENFSFNFSK